MMIIKANAREYEVEFSSNFSFMKKVENIENAIYIIDKKVYELYDELLFENISPELVVQIEATETNKTIETVLSICERMTKLSAKRNARIIAIGGGIIQDITGFAANILYRGIDWVFVPTTLLAACDSCIGGKTSLNYKQYKNLLGTFYPPKNIYICNQFFNTLTQKDYLSGLGEVVKFNIMAGPQGLSHIEKDIDLLIQKDYEKLNTYVHASLNFKKDYIEKDEFDKGVRVYLNFAHTFGHAIETVTDYEIPHGTAVAIGTLAADYISYLRGYLSRDLVKRIETVILKIVKKEVCGTSLLNSFDTDKMIKAIAKDKKQVDSAITAILFYNDDMQLKFCHDIKREEIETAMSYLSDILNQEGNI